MVSRSLFLEDSFDHSSIIQEGYLFKKSLHLGKYRKRYAVLVPDKLIFYKQKPESKEDYEKTKYITETIELNKYQYVYHRAKFLGRKNNIECYDYSQIEIYIWPPSRARKNRETIIRYFRHDVDECEICWSKYIRKQLGIFNRYGVFQKKRNEVLIRPPRQYKFGNAEIINDNRIVNAYIIVNIIPLLHHDIIIPLSVISICNQYLGDITHDNDRIAAFVTYWSYWNEPRFHFCCIKKNNVTFNGTRENPIVRLGWDTNVHFGQIGTRDLFNGSDRVKRYGFICSRSQPNGWILCCLFLHNEHRAPTHLVKDAALRRDMEYFFDFNTTIDENIHKNLRMGLVSFVIDKFDTSDRFNYQHRKPIGKEIKFVSFLYNKYRARAMLLKEEVAFVEFNIETDVYNLENGVYQIFYIPYFGLIKCSRTAIFHSQSLQLEWKEIYSVSFQNHFKSVYCLSNDLGVYNNDKLLLVASVVNSNKNNNIEISIKTFCLNRTQFIHNNDKLNRKYKFLKKNICFEKTMTNISTINMKYIPTLSTLFVFIHRKQFGGLIYYFSNGENEWKCFDEKYAYDEQFAFVNIYVDRFDPYTLYVMPKQSPHEMCYAPRNTIAAHDFTIHFIFRRDPRKEK